MRHLLLAAVLLAATPALARGTKTSNKGPQEGRFCAKAKIGTTATSKDGTKLECKADGKRARWRAAQ